MKPILEATHARAARVLLRLRWGLLGLALAALLLFLGDWAAYKLRGSPTATITVTRFLAVPLKGNRTEFDNEGASQIQCAKALFPQGSQQPCWYLRRHTTQADQI